MKKVLCGLPLICLLLSACATEGVSGVGIMTRVKNCLTEQGWVSITDGRLYTNGISSTAKEISEVCLKKLSLQDVGIETQTSQMATTVLTALVSAKETQK